MEERNTGSRSEVPHKEGRAVWVVTAYGISALALFGVMAYFVSHYLAN